MTASDTANSSFPPEVEDNNNNDQQPLANDNNMADAEEAAAAGNDNARPPTASGIHWMQSLLVGSFYSSPDDDSDKDPIAALAFENVEQTPPARVAAAAPDSANVVPEKAPVSITEEEELEEEGISIVLASSSDEEEYDDDDDDESSFGPRKNYEAVTLADDCVTTSSEKSKESQSKEEEGVSIILGDSTYADDDTVSFGPRTRDDGSILTDACSKSTRDDTVSFGPRKRDDASILTDACSKSTPKDEEQEQQQRSPVFPLWTRLTEGYLHAGIRRGVAGLGTLSAKNPWTCIVSVMTLSFALMFVGLATNFTLVVNHEELFAPTGSLPAKHGHWVNNVAQFPELADMLLIVHAEGENMLHQESVYRVFEALDTLRRVPGYDEVCQHSTYVNPITKEDTCLVFSVTQFWNNNVQHFIEDTFHMDETEFIQVLSQPSFPDGIPVFHDVLFGRTTWEINAANEDSRSNQTTASPSSTTEVSWNRTADEEAAALLSVDWFDFGDSNQTGSFFTAEEPGVVDTENEDGERPTKPAKPEKDLLGALLSRRWVSSNVTSLSKYLTYAPAFVVRVEFPDVPETHEFQERALAKLQSLQQEWDQQSEEENRYGMHLEFLCQYAYQLEYARALQGDMPLVPIIFVVMLGFTMFVYHHYGTRRQPPDGSPLQDHHHGGLWYSRACLGVFSVVTMGAALMSGFGLLFLVGVPFSNITMVAPFIILGTAQQQE